MEAAGEILLNLVVRVVFGCFLNVWGEERWATHCGRRNGRSRTVFEHWWDGAAGGSRGTARFGTESGRASDGGGGTPWGRWWMESVPIPPPSDPFPGREGIFDKFDVEATETPVCSIDEATGLNYGLLVKTCGVVESRGYAATEESKPFEVVDIIVGRAAKAIYTMDEEGNPAEQEEKKEGEFTAAGEVV